MHKNMKKKAGYSCSIHLYSDRLGKKPGAINLYSCNLTDWAIAICTKIRGHNSILKT